MCLRALMRSMCTVRPNKKDLCFQFVSDKKYREGIFIFFVLFFLLRIVVYYIEVEYVYF